MLAGKCTIFLALLACACGAAEPAASGAGGATSMAGGTGVGTRFAGTYEVPVEPALAAAALFTVSQVEWTLSGTRARLTYDLPRELVGKALRVDFAGTLAADGTAQLLGEAGKADCSVQVSTVVCNEQMPGLMPLEPDLAAVEALAADSYAGPASDRLDVARLFGADPIGIARVDLSKPLGAEAERD
ncbi:MAG: hypothetical protein ABUL60_26255 [Myxococcales bacterium]